jgi:nucleoside-diphosphate-sugar epimerase
MAKLVFGCGYLGHRVADRWLAAGETVYVVTRSAARADVLGEQGLTPIVADVIRPATLAGLPIADTVLYAVGYDRTTGESIRKVYVDGLANVLAALPPETGRIVYISSTGVYGQTGGGRVDETSECRPVREGGQACLDAERLLAAHPLGQRAITLRLAGIYGPGRIPSRQQLTAGQPLAVPADGCLNLIHVDDAASVVLAAERRAPLPRLYVVSDGQPVERRMYYEELARMLGAQAPRFVAAPPGSQALARSATDKRIDNARLLGELAVRLAYPSYRQGLAQVVADEQAADEETAS